MSNGPIEPSANVRQAAHATRELYLALVQEGFSEQQALVILGQVIYAQTQNGEQ